MPEPAIFAFEPGADRLLTRSAAFIRQFGWLNTYLHGGKGTKK
jgi:hypothetical protein